MTSTTKHGIELLHDPSLNKSTAFSRFAKLVLIFRNDFAAYAKSFAAYAKSRSSIEDVG